MIDMVDKMSNGVAVTTLKHIKYNIEKAREKDDSIDIFGCDRKALDMAIKALEQQPCEDCIRGLIREFDNKHPALFADYMREFNNHPISEIIEYMWDMHDLIEDIKYRLPDEGGEEE